MGEVILRKALPVWGFCVSASLPEARRELADFLRTRRARLSPEQVGFPTGSRRRTPGLRREEVAQLAAVKP